MALAAVFALPQHSQAQEISVEAVSPYAGGDAEFRFTTSSQFSTETHVRYTIRHEVDGGARSDGLRQLAFPANQSNVNRTFVFRPGTTTYDRIIITVQSHGSTEPKAGMDTATVSRTENEKPGISVSANKTEMMGGQSALFTLGRTHAWSSNEPRHTVHHNLKVTWSPPGLVTMACDARPANVETATSHTCNAVARFWSTSTKSGGGTIETDATKLNGNDGWIKVSADTEQDFSHLSNPVYSPVYNPQANTATVIVKATTMPVQEQKVEFDGWSGGFNGTVLVTGRAANTYSVANSGDYTITKADSSNLEYQIETQKNDETKVTSNIFTSTPFSEGDWTVTHRSLQHHAGRGNDISGLSPGDTRTSTLIITLKDSAGTVIDTERVTVTLRYPALSASFEGGGTTKTITSDNSGNYPDVKANFTMSNNEETNARIGSAGDWIEESSTFLTPNTVVAGGFTGSTTVNGTDYLIYDNFRFGTWFVDLSGLTQYIFKPNAAALDALDNGVSVTYTVSNRLIFGNFAHEISGTRQALTLTLTGNGFFSPVWIEVVSSEVSEGENAMAMFTLKARTMPTAPVRYEVGNSTYLAHSDTGVKTTTESFTASDDIFTLQISIPLLNNSDADNEPGEIVVEILPDDNGSDPERYSVHTDDKNFPHRATVYVLDDDGNFFRQVWIEAVSSEVAEGENAMAMFTLKARAMLSAPIRYEVGNSTFLAQSDTGVKTTTGSFTASNDIYTLQISIPILNNTDEENEPGEIVVEILPDDNGSDPERYTVPTDDQNFPHRATVNVLDDDSSKPFAIISSESSKITEGEDIVFNFSLFPEQNGTVSVNFRIVQDGDFIPFGVPRSVKVSSEGAKLRIATDNDSMEEDDGSLTAIVLSGEGYRGVGRSVKVTIADDDPNSTDSVRYSVAGAVITSILRESGTDASPPKDYADLQQSALPMVSIEAMGSTIKEGEPAIFRISVDSPVVRGIAVRIMFSESGDFATGPMSRSVALAPEATESEFRMETDNDDVAEADGSITATILEDSEYILGESKSSRITVTDDLDRQARRLRLNDASSNVLADQIASLGARSLDAASGRVAQAFTGEVQTRMELAGNSSVKDLLANGGEMMNTGVSDWKTVMAGSSFSVALYPEGEAVSTTTLWGTADLRNASFEGTGDSQSQDAEIFTGHFGFDTLVGQGSLMGMAASVSQAEVEYDMNDGEGLLYDARTTGLHPYFGFTSEEGDSQLRMVGGFGQSEIGLKQDGYSDETLHGNFLSLGMGGSGRVYANRGLLMGGSSELKFNGETWMAWQSVDAAGEVMDGMQVYVHFASMAVEGIHIHEFEGGASVSPKLSFGVRSDGRNGLTASGFELGGGVSYETSNGLSVSGSGLTLMPGLDRIGEWELKGSLDYDHANDSRGVVFNISPVLGGSGTESRKFLWNSQLLDASGDPSMHTDGGRIETELGYGIEVWDGLGLLTPFGAFELEEDNGTKHRLGSRISIGREFEFEIEGIRELQNRNEIEDRMEFSGRIKW